MNGELLSDYGVLRVYIIREKVREGGKEGDCTLYSKQESTNQPCLSIPKETLAGRTFLSQRKSH